MYFHLYILENRINSSLYVSLSSFDIYNFVLSSTKNGHKNFTRSIRAHCILFEVCPATSESKGLQLLNYLFLPVKTHTKTQKCKNQSLMINSPKPTYYYSQHIVLPSCTQDYILLIIKKCQHIVVPSSIQIL